MSKRRPKHQQDLIDMCAGIDGQLRSLMARDKPKRKTKPTPAESTPAAKPSPASDGTAEAWEARGDVTRITEPENDTDAPQDAVTQEATREGDGNTDKDEDAGTDAFDFFWSKLQRLREVCAVSDVLFAAWLENAAERVRGEG